MNVEHTEALTLKTYKYAENHRIAVFLTRNWGIVRGVAYGSRASRSRFGSSLEPLTHLRLTFRLRENQDLATIQNCEIIRPFAGEGLGWERNLYYSYFAELLMEFGQEQEPHEKLFRLALTAIRDTHAPSRLLARWFELWLLQLEGVLPPLGRRLPESLATKTIDMLKTAPDQLREEDWKGQEVELIEGFAGHLIEDHLEKRLKSKRILDELLKPNSGSAPDSLDR